MRKSSYLTPQNAREILAVLNIPVKDRMTQDTARLEELTRDFPLFESLRREGQMNAQSVICQLLTQRSCNKSEVITSIGQKAKQFCMILSGTVGVYARYKKKEQVQKDEQLFLVRTLSQGEWFGEASMVYEEGSLVSFVSLEDTQVATIDQKMFKTVLSQYFLVKMTFQINFLRELPIFWNWSEQDFRVMYQSFCRKKLKREEIVFLQGDKPSCIYIVKEGEFKIFKHFDELRVRKFQDGPYNKNIDQNKNSTKELKQFEEEKNLQVASLAIGEMFGEEDVLLKRIRKFSIVCESNYGELYTLSVNAFNTLILNHEKSKQYINARLNNKQKSYVKRLDSISQYVSSVKVDVLQNHQDQLRLTENFISTRPIKLSEQSRHHPSRQSLTKLSHLTNTVKQNIKLDLPSIQYNFQTQPSDQILNPLQNTSRFIVATESNRDYLNERKSQIISRSSLNFKSLSNLSLNGSMVNTQYFTNSQRKNQSMMNVTSEEKALFKAEIQKEEKREKFMKSYYDKFNFNVVDRNYCENIIAKCVDPTIEQNYQQYAKGSFNNKFGQRGYRCLGIDPPRDTNVEYEKARLKIQEEFDPDYKMKNLQQE